MGRLKNKADDFILSNAVVFCISILILILTAVLLSGCFISKHYAEQLTYETTKDMIGRCGSVISLAENTDNILPEQIADVYISEPSQENVETGEKYLSMYGYSVTMNQRYNKPYYSAYNMLFGLTVVVAVISVVLSSAVGFCIYIKMIKKITRFTEYAKNITNRSYEREKSNIGGVLGCHENCLIMLSERLNGLLASLQEDKLKIKDFISDISHQIKTPVSVLKMNHEILLSEPDMGNAQRQEFLVRNMRQLDRIEWLIMGLLKIARLDAGIVEYSMKNYCLRNTIEKALYGFKSTAEKKQIVFINEVSEGISFSYDENWMLEAVENIIKNSVEHVGNVQPYIKISAVKTPMTVEMKISDNGTGIPENVLPDIFKRFYSKNNSTDSSNTGIGLSMSKKIFEDFGGSICASSCSGKGTEITVTFLTKT